MQGWVYGVSKFCTGLLWEEPGGLRKISPKGGLDGRSIGESRGGVQGVIIFCGSAG